MLNISVSLSTYFPSSFKHLPCQQASECPMQGMMLAVVQATDERLIAFRYLMRISAHFAFSSSAQKDDSHWGPSPDCRAGVVTPLTPVVSQPPESDVQCAVEHYHV